MATGTGSSPGSNHVGHRMVKPDGGDFAQISRFFRTSVNPRQAWLGDVNRPNRAPAGSG